MTTTRLRAGKVTILILFKEVDRHNAQPSKVLTTERFIFFSNDYEMESGSRQGNLRLHITVPLLLSLGSFTAT